MMRILVADDDARVITLWREWLEGDDCTVSAASDGREAVKKAKEEKPDVCVLDLKMPRMDGLKALHEIKAILPECEVIIVTGHADVKSAVSAMKEGAYDYLMKPTSFEEVRSAIERAVERHRLVTENRYLRRELGGDAAYSELIGRTSVMTELKKKIEQASGISATVLIRGESGTGKELVARLIHYGSPRSKGPFVAVNIAALSGTLLESEMFGHEKNSFTGAAEQRKGRFELADGGTLLLDEISEVPFHRQVKFLRVIQQEEIERVGAKSPIRVDVRIMSTTNRDLEELIRQGKFRKDLYYRLNVLYIVVPPLRERKDDIPLLADYYLKTYTRKENKAIDSISPKAMDRLMGFQWPGNVRELMHCIESAVIMEKGGELSIGSLMASKIPETQEGPGKKSSSDSLKDVEKKHIGWVLTTTDGDKKKAAGILGISRTTLYEKIRVYGI